MASYDLTFIPKIRYFVQTGNIPVILVASHGYSIDNDNYESYFDADLSKNEEIKNHLCDYAVEPMISRLAKKDCFYIVNNLTSRKLIDMNRENARYGIFEELNAFRSTIKFICEFAKKKHNKMPLLFDLHSYSSEHESWGDYDIILLEQTKSRMKTNKSLLKFTKDFFDDRGWEIETTSIHNQDDIVETCALEKLAIPLLIEINESILKDEDSFESLFHTFIDYFLKADSKNDLTIDILNESFDSNIHFSKKINDIDKKIIEKQIENIDSLFPKMHQFENLKIKYSEYLNLLYEKIKNKNEPNNKIISSKNDSVGEDFASFIKNLDPSVTDLSLIQDLMLSLSNTHKTIIIPIELFTLICSFIYGEINVRFFEEYGLQKNELIRLFNEENFQKNSGILTPLFEYPINSESYIFSSYGVDNKYYISFFIFPENCNNIPQEDLENDLEFLSQILSIKSLKNKNIPIQTRIEELKKSIKENIF